MNLEEFKKALSSDATEENKQLKKQTFNEIRKTVGLEPIRDCDDVAMEWIRLFSEKEKKNNAEN